MSRLVTILCFLIVLAALPIWLLAAGFSPMLFGAGPENMTRLQKLLGSGLIALIWATPVWVIFFGLRTIRGWRSGSTGSALLMALPGAVMIGLIVFINVVKTAP